MSQKRNEKQSTLTRITGLIGSFQEPKQLGEPYTCQCGETVVLLETLTIGGPNKGKPMVYKKGCKCTEKKLASEAWEIYQQVKQKRIMALFDKNSLIPPKLKTATFASYDPKDKSQERAKDAMMDFVFNYQPDESRNILLTGKTGVGKSYLCVAGIKDLMDRGHSAIFCSVPKLLTKIKQSYDADTKTKEAELLEAVETVDILVLDDIGAENKTDWRTEKLFEIVDARAGRHTLYTTNKNSDELVEHLGERNFSRLMMDTSVFKVTGKDQRVKK